MHIPKWELECCFGFLLERSSQFGRHHVRRELTGVDSSATAASGQDSAYDHSAAQHRVSKMASTTTAKQQARQPSRIQ